MGAAIDGDNAVGACTGVPVQRHATFHGSHHEPESVSGRLPRSSLNRAADDTPRTHFAQQRLWQQLPHHHAIQKERCVGQWTDQQTVIHPSSVVTRRNPGDHILRIGARPRQPNAPQPDRGECPFGKGILQGEIGQLFDEPRDVQIAKV
ncbi:MAG: hypothetical protein A3B67_14280 [Burkholderiales bacterium RIFCSPHIGHO2_02_FULL_66_10]|nr:MAG: hypothetical protein A3B67_14280 [Burkholderiales bacterium RIFCSPHIGHO2_02_FULL_66_10]